MDLLSTLFDWIGTAFNWLFSAFISVFVWGGAFVSTINVIFTVEEKIFGIDTRGERDSYITLIFIALGAALFYEFNRDSPSFTWYLYVYAYPTIVIVCCFCLYLSISMIIDLGKAVTRFLKHLTTRTTETEVKHNDAEK